MKIALRFFAVVVVLFLAACGPPTLGVPTPTISPVVTIKTRNSVIRNPEVVPYTVENCNGQSLVETNPSRSRSTTVEINLTLGGSVEFEAPVKAKLEAAFSVKSGETVGSDQNFTLRADAGRRITYEVTWSETWQVGEADINGVTIPYEVRTGLKADVGSGAPESCPATPTAHAVSTTTTPLSTYTSVPPTTTPVPPSSVPASPIPPTVIPTVEPTVTSVPPSLVIPSPIPPTMTSSPTNTLQTSQQPITALSYPCSANVVSSDVTILNVVRADASENAPLVNPVRPNATVLLLGYVKTSSKWYQIRYDDAKSIGWIPAEYIITSVKCTN